MDQNTKVQPVLKVSNSSLSPPKRTMKSPKEKMSISSPKGLKFKTDKKNAVNWFYEKI